MIILILSQNIPNDSVTMLSDELCRQYEPYGYKIKIWEINENVFISENGMLVKKNFSPYLTALQSSRAEVIDPADIALIIKRTWGDIRTHALNVCKQLARYGVPVMNGCDFIEWSHSKIRQVNNLRDLGLFPETQCYTWSEIDDEERFDIEEIERNIGFPCIVKSDRGTRGDGVYRADSPSALREVINYIKEKIRLGDGCLIQSFIPTNIDISISDYFRINLVNGHAQSAVLFQLRWQSASNGSFHELKDNIEIDIDCPVYIHNVNIFPPDQLKKIEANCPYSIGVVGIDVMRSRDGILYLLEFNDGPTISHIVNLGQNSIGNEEKFEFNQSKVESDLAAKACIDFPNSYAACCLSQLRSLPVLSNDKSTFLL